MNSKNYNIVYLALGSNLGNRFANFNKCTQMLRNFVEIQKTSQIYESPCIDQNNLIMRGENKFINSVIKVGTLLSPSQLLAKCKEIETVFNRKAKKNYYEEREIDIDILLYNDQQINEHTDVGNLKIPHVNLTSRTFVMKPLLDIDSDMKVYDRSCKEAKKVKDLLSKLMIEKSGEEIDNILEKDKIGYLSKVLALNNERFFDLGKRALLMGIINTTPDSFSGGLLKASDRPYHYILELLQENKEYVDIIDIGGESTRPGAKEVSAEEELARISKLISMLKNSSLKEKIISVDTRKSYVAEEAIKLGADVINDVSGGQFDEKILEVVSRYEVPYICMHSRANPDIMSQKKYLRYNEGKEHLIIAEELETRLKKCRSYGIPDWRIILDPGIGFSKVKQQNFNVVRNLSYFKQKFGNALLLGHSRKKFIREELDDTYTKSGDVTISSLGLSQGVNILRVHDFKENFQAIKLSSKIFN